MWPFRQIQKAYLAFHGDFAHFLIPHFGGEYSGNITKLPTALLCFGCQKDTSSRDILP